MKVKEKCTLCLGVVSIQDAATQTLTNLYCFDPLLIAKVYKFTLFICALMCPQNADTPVRSLMQFYVLILRLYTEGKEKYPFA